jgi:hypothetical protein
VDDDARIERRARRRAQVRRRRLTAASIVALVAVGVAVPLVWAGLGGSSPERVAVLAKPRVEKQQRANPTKPITLQWVGATVLASS